jgi:hypothetical protein
VMPQFVASLADDSRVVIYDRNMFIVQASGMGQGTNHDFGFKVYILVE